MNLSLNTIKKRLFFLSFGILLCSNIYAQQSAVKDKDTLLYYVDHNNKIVDVKDSAAYFLLIMPSDTTSGSKIYPIIEYYPTMKKKLIAYSQSQKYYSLVFEGQQTEFYPNGNKKSIRFFSNGAQIGRFILYYPNGKLYADEAIGNNGKTLLIKCQDTTGNVLSKDGNGKWVKYDDNFNKIGEGAIKDSLEDGEWVEKISGKNDTTVFSKGKVISSTNKDRIQIFTAVEHEPRFIGDFGAYLGRNIIYPAYAKEHHIQGKVFVQFVVEKDGSLTGFKIAKSSGSEDIDNEAVRVLRISPKWQPGMQNNKSVRVMYTVPISFSLRTEND